MPPKRKQNDDDVEIVDVYKVLPTAYIHKKKTYANYSKINIDIPMAAIIIGSMGSGKTQIVYNLFKNMSCFTHVYLFVKDLNEPIYKFLIDTLEKLGAKIGKQLITYSDDIKNVPTVEQFDKEENNLVVFDDLLLDKEAAPKRGSGAKTGADKILDIYIRGRRQNVSCLYVSQSYYDIPGMIRKNANYIFIKKINTTSDLNRIVAEYQLSVSKKEILEYYKQALATKTKWLLVDLKTNEDDLKFRIGFKGIQQPSADV